jgi:hypothetical protein
MIVTFPRAFHGGLNTGFNIAEATNMGYDTWNLNYRELMHKCICINRRLPPTPRFDLIDLYYKKIRSKKK